MPLTGTVAAAIEEVKATFASQAVEVVEDGQGGARVTVHDLDIGAQHQPSRTTVGFVVGFHYPASDVYPHYIMPPISRVDGRALGSGLSATMWNGVPSIQVSRRSNHWQAGVDTAAIKLQKVLAWLRSL